MREQIRTWVRWPLYSPRRLAAVLVGLVVVVCVISALNGSSTPSPTADAKQAPASASASTPSPGGSSPAASPSASPDLGFALTTARTFVAAWASHTKPQQWYATLAPLCTERLATKLASTDPSRIAATKAGAAKVTDTGGGEMTSAAVETDAGPVTVGMVWNGAAWLVRDIEPGTQAAG